MMSLDKCDLFYENPLFEPGLPFKDQVNYILLLGRVSYFLSIKNLFIYFLPNSETIS